jgi:hypothetical protein
MEKWIDDRYEGVDKLENMWKFVNSLVLYKPLELDTKVTEEL